MALNPELSVLPNGEVWPTPFEGEHFGLQREGVEIHLNDIPNMPPNGDSWKARGRIFLSSVRIVFLADVQQRGKTAFDLPLVYIHGDAFNQPILGCNNLSGKVWSILNEGGPSGSFPPIRFKINFTQGGVGTFLRLFYSFRNRLRVTHSASTNAAPSAPPISDMVAQAFVDPNDPSNLILTHPVQEKISAPSYAKNYGKDERYESMD